MLVLFEKGGKQAVFDVISAANYLEQTSLLNLGLAQIATLMKATLMKDDYFGTCSTCIGTTKLDTGDCDRCPRLMEIREILGIDTEVAWRSCLDTVTGYGNEDEKVDENANGEPCPDCTNGFVQGRTDRWSGYCNQWRCPKCRGTGTITSMQTAADHGNDEPKVDFAPEQRNRRFPQPRRHSQLRRCSSLRNKIRTTSSAPRPKRSRKSRSGERIALRVQQHGLVSPTLPKSCPSCANALVQGRLGQWRCGKCSMSVLNLR